MGSWFCTLDKHCYYVISPCPCIVLWRDLCSLHAGFHTGIRNGIRSKQAVWFFHTNSTICNLCSICRNRFVPSLLMASWYDVRLRCLCDYYPWVVYVAWEMTQGLDHSLEAIIAGFEWMFLFYWVESKAGLLCTGQKLAPCEYNRTRTLILVEYASAVYVDCHLWLYYSKQQISL